MDFSNTDSQAKLVNSFPTKNYSQSKSDSFRNNQSKKISYLEKLKNNYSVEYIKENSNFLNDFERIVNSLTNTKEFNIFNSILSFSFSKIKAKKISYELKFNNENNYLTCKLDQEGPPIDVELIIKEREYKFQGKEVYCYLVKIDGKDYILKYPKRTDFDYNLKVKSHLIAKDLAKRFSNL